MGLPVSNQVWAAGLSGVGSSVFPLHGVSVAVAAEENAYRFAPHGRREIQSIEDWINNWPMKRLGFQTPNEVFTSFSWCNSRLNSPPTQYCPNRILSVNMVTPERSGALEGEVLMRRTTATEDLWP